MRASIAEIANLIRDFRNGRELRQAATEMHVPYDAAADAAQVWPIQERLAAARGC